VATGKVKWYKPSKGFGFVKPSGGGEDIFLHKSTLERIGLTDIKDGQMIRYDLAANREGKTQADAIELIEDDKK